MDLSQNTHTPVTVSSYAFCIVFIKNQEMIVLMSETASFLSHVQPDLKVSNKLKLYNTFVEWMF